MRIPCSKIRCSFVRLSYRKKKKFLYVYDIYYITYSTYSKTCDKKKKNSTQICLWKNRMNKKDNEFGTTKKKEDIG